MAMMDQTSNKKLKSASFADDSDGGNTNHLQSTNNPNLIESFSNDVLMIIASYFGTREMSSLAISCQKFGARLQQDMIGCCQ